MHVSARPLVVVVRPGADPRRVATVLCWLRWLVPAALLFVARAPAEVVMTSSVVTLDADVPELRARLKIAISFAAYGLRSA
jgi:hypothetical protein